MNFVGYPLASSFMGAGTTYDTTQPVEFTAEDIDRVGLFVSWGVRGEKIAVEVGGRALVLVASHQTKDAQAALRKLRKQTNKISTGGTRRDGAGVCWPE